MVECRRFVRTGHYGVGSHSRGCGMRYVGAGLEN